MTALVVWDGGDGGGDGGVEDHKPGSPGEMSEYTKSAHHFNNHKVLHLPRNLVALPRRFAARALPKTAS